jgi:hypothetical protein
MLDALRMLRRTVPKERVNRREPHVAGGSDIAALDLEVVKKIEHVLRPEILHIQISHRAPRSIGDET